MLDDETCLEAVANTGLVVSGGGMRGADEAGVLVGLMECLGARAAGTPVFQLFARRAVRAPA